MKTRGISFVEIIIASAIILAMVGTFIGTYLAYMGEFRDTTDTIAAGYLLEEGVEAVKTIRDRSYSDEIAVLATDDTKHYLTFNLNESEWQSTSTSQYVDSTYKRWFTLSETRRDGNDKIASSGNLDGGTRKLTISVAWRDGNGTTTRSVTTYITDMHQ